MLAKLVFTALICFSVLSLGSGRTQKVTSVLANKSCQDIFNGNISNQLTEVLNSAKSRTNDSIVREYFNSIGTTYFYDRDAHIQSQEQIRHVVEIAVGELDARSAVISSETLNEAPSVTPISSINTGPYLFSIKSIGDGYQKLEIASGPKKPGYSVIDGEGLTQLAVNKNGIFVYANESGTSQIIQVTIPAKLPHTNSLYVKTFDVSLAFLTDRFSPIMIGFSKFLILGGSHLGILNTETGIYVKLELTEDTVQNRIVQMELDDSGSLLKMVRAVMDPYSRNFQYKKMTLDLAKLK